jgi:heme iron utilization protein
MAAPPDPADLRAEAKRLLRSVRAATLATIAPGGMPFASLTAIATQADGCPILLLSRLAQHTLQLETDGRCSILLAQGGQGDPLAHPRLTLTGHAVRLDPEAAPEARRRFLARNPKAELYADFPDFSFWRMTPDGAHLNGGFGRAAQFVAADILTDTTGCEALLAGEEGAVAHMNADHRDAIRLYATRLLGLPDREWRLSGLDPDGLDLLSGTLTGRLAFAERVSDGGTLRKLLVELAARARSVDA